MRSGDKEVASATVCQGPAARASMDKKTPKKNRHSESGVTLTLTLTLTPLIGGGGAYPEFGPETPPFVRWPMAKLLVHCVLTACSAGTMKRS